MKNTIKLLWCRIFHKNRTVGLAYKTDEGWLYGAKCLECSVKHPFYFGDRK